MITANEAREETIQNRFKTDQIILKTVPCVLEFLEILIKNKVKEGEFELNLVHDFNSDISDSNLWKLDKLLKQNSELAYKKWKVEDATLTWADLKRKFFTDSNIASVAIKELEKAGYSVEVFSYPPLYTKEPQIMKRFKISWGK